MYVYIYIYVYIHIYVYTLQYVAVCCSVLQCAYKGVCIPLELGKIDSIICSPRIGPLMYSRFNDVLVSENAYTISNMPVGLLITLITWHSCNRK